MAVDPDVPFNREEMYLAAAAGEGVTVPECPWSRKEAYLADIGGRLDDMDTRIAALATDISFKGSVATEDDLPSGAAVGDAYITEDTGVMYVWVGDSWVALGGTGINVVQTTGTSTTDVMSQNATTGMVYDDPSVKRNINIGDRTYTNYTANNSRNIAIGDRVYAGANANTNAICIGFGNTTYQGEATGAKSVAIGHCSSGLLSASGESSIALGDSATASTANSIAIGAKTLVQGGASSISIGSSSDCNASGSDGAIALGAGAKSRYKGSVAIGFGATAAGVGQMDIGTHSTAYGYNNTTYRLLTGVHDPVNAHDAATKGYVDGHLGGLTFVALTQAEYDLINTPDPDTLYIIKAA